uniref:Ionotropic glutamate receptor L-glutamate and glycine-binding domain-containing protein n=1 Tax=Anopheles stephensi TaxID=30069 RepID=A0A182YGS4_ANOST
MELVDRMDYGHCYAILFDEVYEHALRADFFHHIHHAARYVVKIAQDEDTFDPGPALRCILENIRRVGCGGYVILMGNGIQLERLLRYGDKTRILDTRARYIIMHNYRLFVPQLHYIWKRIVDVLFVRPLRKKSFKWTERNRDSSPVYELSTVPFPMPIKGVFFSKIVDFWQAVYYGVEIELLKAISKAMRFNMVFYETFDADAERWGTVRDNETLTGLLREMHEGRADFALADLHHTEYNLGFMDLSIPYNTECLTFLTPEALSDNSWKTLILPFNGEMWAGVLISLFSVGFVFYAFSNTLHCIHHHKRAYQPEHDLLQRHHNRKGRTVNPFKKRCLRAMRTSKLPYRLKRLVCREYNIKKYSANNALRNLHMIPFKRKPEPWHDPLPAYDIFDTFAGCIIYTYSMLLLVSLPRLPAGWPLRVLTGWYWVYCVLVVVAYRASFTAILANPIPRLTIDTLQDLAESSISCGAWGEQNRLFFQMAQDPYSQTIGAKLEHAPDHNQAVEKVSEGMYAYYENIYLLRQLRSTRKSEKARQTLHIMQECAVHMPISIGLEKNSPLKHQVDRHVRALIEGGLTIKWLSDAIERFQSNIEIPPQEATIDLKKMYAGFVALGFGYAAAVFAFIAEKLYWRYYIETNPSFDKFLHGFTFFANKRKG